MFECTSDVTLPSLSVRASLRDAMRLLRATLGVRPGLHGEEGTARLLLHPLADDCRRRGVHGELKSLRTRTVLYLSCYRI